MIKKLFSTLLALCFVLALLPATQITVEASDPDVWDGTIPNANATYAFSGGDGSENDPYTISSAANLAQLSANVKAGTSYDNKYFKLTSDIVLNNNTNEWESWGTTPPANKWTPIGTSSYHFKGTFDGQNHTISGIYINSTTAAYQGLFGKVDAGGSVKNVTVDKSYIYSTKTYVGAIVGQNYGTIENCTNKGTIVGTAANIGGIAGASFGTLKDCKNFGSVSGGSTVGGIAGKSQNSTSKVIGCTNSGAVSGSSYVGGILGANGIDTGSNVGGTVENCHNTGEIGKETATNVGGVVGYINSGSITNCDNTGVVEGTSQVGGVAGYNYKGSVTSCYNTGVVSGTGDNVGGVAGYNYNGSITGCYNAGAVSRGYSVGGVVGYNYGTIKNCYNAGSVSGTSRVGGVVGDNESADVGISSCYNTGEVSGTNQVGGVAGYNKGKVTSCYNAGAVSGDTNVGGVVGNNNSSVMSCYNAGAVSGDSFVGGVTWNNYKTVASCYYDKQMCLIYGAEGKLTSEMVGAKLKAAANNDPWGADNWVFDDDNKLYPRLTGMHDTDVAYVSAYPLTLANEETVATVKSNFTVSTVNGITWQSSDADIIKIADGAATVTRQKVDTPVTLTATKGAAAKTVKLTVAKAPSYAVSATTNGVPANGVTATATFGDSPNTPGSDVTVTITLSGKATLAGTHTVGLTSAEDVETIKAPEIVTKSVAINDTPTNTFEFTFTMPDHIVDDLVVTHTFALPKSTKPTADTATVKKTASSQASVEFTLNSDLTGTWSVYDALTGGNVVTGVTASANGTTLTLSHATNVPAGTYYVSVTEEGKSESARLALTVVAAPSSGSHSSSGSSSSSHNSDHSAANIIVNGEKQSAGDAKTSKKEGKTITTVTVDDNKLNNVLKEKGQGAEVVIPVTTDATISKGSLDGQMVKSMETKEATLEIRTNAASYILPASEIDIDSVSEQFGKEITLSDIDVEIEIAEPTDQTVSVVEDAANKGNFTIMVPAVNFTITCHHNGQTTNVSSFHSYVNRRVAIPEGIDHTKITTGLVVEPDGTTRHVPTKIVEIDGKYYAEINSLTNSTYTVVYHPVEFDDIADHWAKESINNMGSRMVVNGVGENDYNPDGAVTRAEVAAIVIRALGLEKGIGEENFTDVNESDWFCGAVKTAVSYDLINGCGNGTFKPNDEITREQVMAIIVRSMDKTGLEAELSETEISEILSEYEDSTSISNYATDSIATCIKTGVVNGKTKTSLAPQNNISRAEVAVIVERLLQQSDLI